MAQLIPLPFTIFAAVNPDWGQQPKWMPGACLLHSELAMCLVS